MGWGQRSIQDVPWVCVDVETTGLEVQDGHRICEIAAVKGTVDGEVDEFTSLVNPGIVISAEAAAVSGISNADVAEAPTFADLASAAHEFLVDAVIVAHNSPFDAGFLETEFQSAGLSLPAAPVIDTTVVAQSIIGLPMRNLPAVARALGQEHQPTHRALDDVWATRDVLLAGLRRLMRRGAQTVGDVVEALLPFPVASLPVGPFPVIAGALKTGADIRITYQGGTSAGERVIRPIRLEEYRGSLLLAAYCRKRSAPRTFRVDRIASASPVDPEP